MPQGRVKLNLTVINDLFERAYMSTTSVNEVNQIHVVYDSYLEGSLKECERIQRQKECGPLELVNLTENTTLPVQMDRFWACPKIEQNLQLISKTFFQQKSIGSCIKIVFSGFVSDEGISHGLECKNGESLPRLDLSSSIEETDGRIIPHIAKAIENGCKRMIVHSNDADVLTFILYHMYDYFRCGVSKVWMKYGTGTKKRYIPLHTIATSLGETKSKLIMKIHIVSGCDVTSKIGTESAALKKNPDEYLQLFGEKGVDNDLAFKNAEKYLLELLRTGSKCSTFDELRYHFCTMKVKSLNELPPNSLQIQGHLKRCYYVIRLNSMSLCYNQFDLNPRMFGWKCINSAIMPEKTNVSMPEYYTVACGCKSGVCKRRCKCRLLNVS